MRIHLRHFMTIGIGTFINILIGLLTTPIITRLVNTTDYGALSMFNTYTSMVVMVLCLGLDQSLIRFYYDKNSIEYKRRLITSTAWISLVISLVLCILGYYVFNKKNWAFEFKDKILVCLIINICIQLFFRFSQLILRVEYKTKIYALLNSTNKLVYLIMAVVMFKYIHNADKFFLLILATIISTSIPLLMGIIVERKLWCPLLNFSKEEFDVTSVFRFGLPFIFSMGITTIFEALDKLTINYFCDYSEVGIYASAIMIVNVFSILQTTFNTVWAPMAIEQYTNDSENIDFFRQVNNVITVLMFGFGCTLIMFKDIFILLLGENYRSATYIIPFLIFRPIMYTISETTSVGIDFAKKSQLHIIVAAVACIVNAIGNFILVPIFSGRGAAISTGISYIVFFSVRTFFGKKYYDYKPLLNKQYLLIGVTTVFAMYSTFVTFNVLCIGLYGICMCTIVYLYKKTIIQIINYLHDLKTAV